MSVGENLSYKIIDIIIPGKSGKTYLIPTLVTEFPRPGDDLIELP